MHVRIARGLLNDVVDRAAASPHAEVCGLLLGTDAHILAAPATANVAPDPARTFEIDPSALFAALRAERAGGPRLLGHYHSHPGGSTLPSARDAAAAEPGKLWLILGATPPALYLATDGGFRRCELVVG